jgi:ribonuclease VapC
VIVDTSAIMAMLLDEPDQQEIASKFEAAPIRRMSAGSWVELAVVLDRRGDRRLSSKLAQLLAMRPMEIASMTSEQAVIGADCYRRYGKGNHPARLNFGDCFAYALAKATGEPLLFKGEDFVHTDIKAA